MKPPKQIARKAATPKKGTPYIWDGKEVYLYHVRNPMLYIISTDASFESAKDMYEAHPDELTEPRKAGTSIVSRPKPASVEEKEHQDKVNQFFIRMAMIVPPDCENCHQPLHAFTLETKRCVTAHVLPKRKEYGFPSVADNDDNCMFLGVHCGCHDFYDHGKASDRAEMNCYPLAIERYNKFKHLLTDKEIIRAEKYLFIQKP